MKVETKQMLEKKARVRYEETKDWSVKVQSFWLVIWSNKFKLVKIMEPS